MNIEKHTFIRIIRHPIFWTLLFITYCISLYLYINYRYPLRNFSPSELIGTELPVTATNVELEISSGFQSSNWTIWFYLPAMDISTFLLSLPCEGLNLKENGEFILSGSRADWKLGQIKSYESGTCVKPRTSYSGAYNYNIFIDKTDDDKYKIYIY